jgi:hypothetical protein
MHCSSKLFLGQSGHSSPRRYFFFSLVTASFWQPWNCGKSLGFKSFDRISVLERHVDIIDAAHEPFLSQWTDVEGVADLIRHHQRLIWKINRDLDARALFQSPPEVVDDWLGKNNCQYSVLNAVHLEYLAKAWPDEGPETKIHYGVCCALTRGATSKIDIGDEDLRIAIGWHVQNEISARTASFIKSKVVKERIRIVVTRPPVSTHESARKDHAGVNFRDVKRSCDSSQDRERKH